MGYVIDLQNNDMEFSYFLFYAKEYRFDLFQHWYFLMNERDVYTHTLGHRCA